MTTNDIASKLGLTIAATDVNGYARTTESFEYKTTSGRKLSSKNLTLIIEKFLDAHKCGYPVEINGIEIQSLI